MVLIKTKNKKQKKPKKTRHRDQWNRIENPEVDTQMDGQQIFDKAGKSIQWKKDSLFSKRYWETGQQHAEE